MKNTKSPTKNLIRFLSTLSLQLIVVATLVLGGSRANAQGWSVGFGYHNPPGATVGLNFMRLWTNFAVELGLGYIGKSESWNTEDDRKTTAYTVAGDVNFKYLFLNGGFRPYIQGGFGTALSTASNGSVSAGASLSHPFGGVGFFAMGSSVYMYASYLFLNASTFQVGIGFPF